MRTLIVPLVLIIGSIGYDPPTLYDLTLNSGKLIEGQLVVRLEYDSVFVESGAQYYLMDIASISVTDSDQLTEYLLSGIGTGAAVGWFIGCVQTPIACSMDGGPGSAFLESCSPQASAGAMIGAPLGAIAGALLNPGPREIRRSESTLEEWKIEVRKFFENSESPNLKDQP